MANQQSKEQKEFNKIYSRRLSSNRVVITSLISQDVFSYIKEKIQPLFGKVPHSNFGINAQYFLDLYKKIYNAEETDFSIIEIGIISDLFNIYYKVDTIDEIEEMLLYKQQASALSAKYHEIKNKCELETHRELQSKIKIETI